MAAACGGFVGPIGAECEFSARVCVFETIVPHTYVYGGTSGYAYDARDELIEEQTSVRHGPGYHGFNNEMRAGYGNGPRDPSHTSF
jgi:hypothetical protein